MKYNFNDLSQFSATDLLNIEYFCMKLQELNETSQCNCYFPITIKPKDMPIIKSTLLKVTKISSIKKYIKYTLNGNLETVAKAFKFLEPLETIYNKSPEEIELIHEIVKIELNKRETK